MYIIYVYTRICIVFTCAVCLYSQVGMIPILFHVMLLTLTLTVTLTVTLMLTVTLTFRLTVTLTVTLMLTVTLTVSSCSRSRSRYLYLCSADFGAKGAHSGKEFVISAEEAKAWTDKNMLQK
jgi:hypothetical protein